MRARQEREEGRAFDGDGGAIGRGGVKID